MVAPINRNQAERGAASERSFAALGQNQRPGEKQTKTACLPVGRDPLYKK